MKRSELEVRVDGVTRTVWDVAGQGNAQFEIAASAELIELFAADSDGEFPLASWLVAFDPASGHQQSVDASLVLPGGLQRILLRVSPDQAGRRAEVELTYLGAGATTVDVAAR